MLKYLVESILTTKKYFFRSFFQKQPGFPLKASQNNQLPLFALKAGYRTIPLTAERPKLFPHTGLDPREKISKNFILKPPLLNTVISKIAFRTSFLNSNQESKFLVMLMTTGPSRGMSKLGSTILSCIYQKSSQKVQIVQNSKVQTMQDF